MADKNINSLKKELLNLSIMKKSGQLTDTSQFKKLKKQIASLLTKERMSKSA
jgi:ribosomal protein L29